MTTASRFITWTSLAIVTAGLALHLGISHNLASGAWVARPPPPGFGRGGPKDKISACSQDLAAWCTGARGAGGARVICLRDNFLKLSPGCQAVFPVGQAAGNRR